MAVGGLRGPGRFIQTGGTVRLKAHPGRIAISSTSVWDASDFGGVHELRDGHITAEEITNSGLTVGGFRGGLFQQHGGTVEVGLVTTGGSNRDSVRSRYELHAGELAANVIDIETSPDATGRSEFLMTGGQVRMSRNGQIRFRSGDWTQTGGELTTGEILTVPYLDSSSRFLLQRHRWRRAFRGR